jgi:hypothetical protein
MAKTMEIGGHGGHIKIDVQAYERTETSDADHIQQRTRTPGVANKHCRFDVLQVRET